MTYFSKSDAALLRKVRIPQVVESAVPPSTPAVNKYVLSVTYDGDGRVTRADYDDGSYRLIAYDSEFLVDTMENYDVGDVLLSTYQAGYDGNQRFIGWDVL